MIPLPDLPIVVTPTEGIAQLSDKVDCVYMDPVVFSWPAISQRFIYYHELGHILFPQPKRDWKFSVEEQCDAYAAERLINEGCSDIEIEYAMKGALPDNEERKKRIRSVKWRLLWM